MIMKIIAVLVVLLIGCEYTGEDLTEGQGVYVCKSNQGRPDIYYHSSTLTIRRLDLGGTAIAMFTELDTGVKYTLHSIEDRDYDCGTKVDK